MEEMVCSTKESSAATLKRLHGSRGGAKARATDRSVKPVRTPSTRTRAPTKWRRADPREKINETNLDKDARAARGLDLLLRHRGK